MRNIKLEIEYDGTNYSGWQTQRKTQNAKRKIKTIQEAIEKALRKILQEKIKLIGSGRTDSGVHALAQVANFQTNSGISTEKLQRALNGLLPEDIAVNEVEEASFDFHARFAVKSKIYRYIILNGSHRSAFLKNRACFYPFPLDIKLMRKASRFLLSKHDFKAFCASGSNVKNTVRTIKCINIKKLRNTQYTIHNTPDLIAIDIEADGFLYNMARSIVGTLIEIGRGKFPSSSLKKILISRNRRFVGPTAPAHGLCLIKVNY